MFEELQLALMDLITPERLFVILEAHRVLNDLGNDDIDDELQQIIGLQDGISDNDLFISRIEGCLKSNLSATLDEFSIKVIPDVTMVQLIGLLQTVGNFDNYIIPQVIDDVLNSDLSNIEKLANIVGMFSELDEDEIYDIVITVDDSLIERMSIVISDILSSKLNPNKLLSDQELRVARINAINNQTHGKHPSITYSLSYDGVAIGQNFEVILSMSIDRLDVLPVNEMAYELVGLAYFSNTPIAQIQQVLRDSVDELTDDIIQQQRLVNQIESVYREFSDINEVVL